MSCINCHHPIPSRFAYTARDGSEFLHCPNCDHDVHLGISFGNWCRPTKNPTESTVTDTQNHTQSATGHSHQLLLLATAHMPVKTIFIDGTPYLERYFAGKQHDGTQYWLHHYLTADTDRHLHSHPWTATSTVLCGQYTERLYNNTEQTHSAGQQNHIPAGKLHQIVKVQPGTWTLMRVQPERAECWHFINEETGQLTPQNTSAHNWYAAYKPRPAANASEATQ